MIFRIEPRAGCRINGAPAFIIFETEHQTVESLTAALAAGLVSGHALYTRSNGPGRFLVIKREAISIRIDDVKQVSIPRAQYETMIGARA
jgi:hypothetical protein